MRSKHKDIPSNHEKAMIENGGDTVDKADQHEDETNCEENRTNDDEPNIEVRRSSRRRSISNHKKRASASRK